MKRVRYKRFPRFFASFANLVEAADGDVLSAVKPHLASFGAALVAAERRAVPVILDVDDLDVAFRPQSQWAENPWMTDLAQPKSAIYVSLLTRAAGSAAAITVSSTAPQRRFRARSSRTAAIQTCSVRPASTGRSHDAFSGSTVLLCCSLAARQTRTKALEPSPKQCVGSRTCVWPSHVARAISPLKSGARRPVHRIPLVPYTTVPSLLAADVVAIPQLDSEFARYQMPMKIFDAMAMAKPIVASAVSDMPMVLETCGRVVPPGDVDRLAEALADLLANPDEAQRLGARARTRCTKEYGREQIGNRLKAVVNGVCSTRAM
jgi:hypothetical protein